MTHNPSTTTTSSLFSVLLLFHSYANAQNSSSYNLCNLCGDNTDSITNGDLSIPFLAIDGSPNPTCQELAEWAAPLPASTTTCDTIQAQSHFCGCPSSSGNPLNRCSLCEKFQIPNNPELVTPFGDTCDELDTYIRFLSIDQCETERIQQIQKTGVMCGCPNAKADCYMCSDFTNNLENHDRIIPWALDTSIAASHKLHPTCQELADWQTLFIEGDDELQYCQDIQSHSFYCGCQSNADNSPRNVCGLCDADGSMPNYPNRQIFELEMTCAELDLYLNYMPGVDCASMTERIQDLQQYAFYCGCPGAKAPCPMCPDGSIEITNEDSVIPYLALNANENPTCLEVAAFGSRGTIDAETCTNIQDQANYCGCFVNQEGPLNQCSFCPNGDEPTKPSVITPSGDSCNELDDYVRYLTADQCSGGPSIFNRFELITASDFLCGCPGATTTCPLCSDGTFDIDYPHRHIPILTVPPDISNPTCQDVVWYLAEQDEDVNPDTCSSMQELASYCGCATKEAGPNKCALCLNGGQVANPTKVVSELFTCKDLQEYLAFLSEDQCKDTDRVQRIQAFAYTCGCQGVEQPACTLCPKSQNPNFTPDFILSDGVTCSEYATRIEAIPAETCEEDKTTIERIAATCGCEGAEFPVCAIRENAELCTVALLESVASKDCECYSFCDDQFVKCESSLGGLLKGGECPNGKAISGCNLAGAVDRDKYQSKGGRSSAEASSRLLLPAWTIILLVVFLKI